MFMRSVYDYKSISYILFKKKNTDTAKKLTWFILFESNVLLSKFASSNPLIVESHLKCIASTDRIAMKVFRERADAREICEYAGSYGYDS